MKKVLLVAAMLLIASASMFAQAPASPWLVGVSANVAVPMGDFSNLTSVGIGGLAWGGYVVNENLTATVKSGYLHFGGKDITTILGTTKSTFGIIPILVGGKYYFTPAMEETSMRLYGAVDLGLYASSVTVDVPSTTVGGFTFGGGSVSSSSTDFGFAPAVGAQFKAGEKMNVDVNANFTYIATSGTATTWVGVGVGLEFGL